MTNIKDQDAELREQLAAIEHERWADWQEWLHSRLRPEKVLLPEDMTYVETGNMVMSKEDFAQWQRQIATPYAKLSEREKASDMEQVDRYWPLIKARKERLVREAHEQGHSIGFKNGKWASMGLLKKFVRVSGGDTPIKDTLAYFETQLTPTKQEDKL